MTIFYGKDTVYLKNGFYLLRAVSCYSFYLFIFVKEDTLLGTNYRLAKDLCQVLFYFIRALVRNTIKGTITDAINTISRTLSFFIDWT